MSCLQTKACKKYTGIDNIGRKSLKLFDLTKPLPDHSGSLSVLVAGFMPPKDAVQGPEERDVHIPLTASHRGISMQRRGKADKGT